MDNRDMYRDSEFNLWVDRENLLPQEKYLFDKYLVDQNLSILEAGTGGGRLSLYLDKKGFKTIKAFDFVPEMIKNAKNKHSNVDFMVADATDLVDISDHSFEYAIYLQQIISFVPDILISQALKESYRVLKKDGVILFSFLNYKGRNINPLLSFAVNIVRNIRGEKWKRQVLPWLKVGRKMNFKLFYKDQAMTYWFEEDEIIALLKNTGFKILEIKKDNMLYIVCQK